MFRKYPLAMCLAILLGIAPFSPLDAASFKPSNAKELLVLMQANAKKATYKEFTFTQETIRFNKNGSVRDTTTWYEALRFPDRFRIDFGEPKEGNAVIYRNDSVYLFKESELVRSGPEVNELLLMVGGIREYPMDTILGRMQRQGYDLSRFHKDKYKGQPVYVIGAKKGDLKRKQIWIHREKLVTVRRIDPKGKRILDVFFGDYIFQDGGWIETWVEFSVNGKLLQTERYKSINTAPNIRETLFDPSQFGDGNW